MYKFDYKKYKLPLALFLVFCLFCFIFPKTGHKFDMQDFATWAKAIFTDGIGYAYNTPTLNYNPGFLYILKLYGLIQGSLESIDKNIIYLRLFTLVFDFAGIYFIIEFLKKLNINPLKSFIILLNIAYLYNTLVWGQVDGIHSFFIFAAFLAAIYNRPSLSVILYLLALNTKLQSIVFLPPLLLIIAPSLLLHKKEIIKCVIAGIVVELIILSPFILTHSIHSIKEVNINSVDHFPYASLNAFNVWHLLLLPAADPLNTSDTVKFMNISYKHWGLVMFIMSSAIVLFPMLLVAFRNIITKSIFNSADSAIIFLTAGLIAIFFFFFNTQMHERYIHPAIILIGIYAIINKDYVFYFILSVSYVLNLEKALQSLHLNYNTFIFDSKFIASLLSACIIWGFYQLYCLYSPHFIAFKNQPKHNII